MLTLGKVTLALHELWPLRERAYMSLWLPSLSYNLGYFCYKLHYLPPNWGLKFPKKENQSLLRLQLAIHCSPIRFFRFTEKHCPHLTTVFTRPLTSWSFYRAGGNGSVQNLYKSIVHNSNDETRVHHLPNEDLISHSEIKTGALSVSKTNYIRGPLFFIILECTSLS